MSKLLLIVFFCCLSATILAQTPQQTFTVKGIAVDSATSRPLSYATVMLLDAKTKQPVKGGLTKEDGGFELKSVVGKAYQLTVATVGYKSQTMNISGAAADVNVGNILLSVSSNKLKEVSVTAVRPIMKQEVDRISYDVQADPDNVALSVLEMMQKVPLLTVDGNDNIQLKGSGNYKILINGKESALVAKNPSDILKSMSASNIEKIEVITTPPAKYDAEGLAGIINIITKRNAGEGYSVAINTRVNTVYGPGGNINVTFKQGKFGMSLLAGGGSNGTQTTGLGSTENIFASNTHITQTGTNSQTGTLHFGGTDLSYEIDTLNLITASFDLFGTNQTQHGPQSSTTDSLSIAQQAYNLQNSGSSSSLGLDASINYQLGFKNSKDRLLTFSYKYSSAPNKQFNDNLFTSRFNYPLALFPDYQQYNDAGNEDHTIQVDYAGPLTRQLSIEAGAKAIFRNNYSNYHVDDRDTVTQQYVTNDALTNDFSYHQDIYSIYNSYQLKMEKWTGKAGLRLEHTALSADFSSAGVNTAPSYSNLIPSISMERDFGTSSIDFGFTQRIQRPGIFQLNPFVDRTNPIFVTTGNPELKAELDNTFELTYSNFTKNSFNVGLSYAFSNNSIQNVSSLHTEQVDGKMDTVTSTTFENLGTNKTLGFNVNTALNLTQRFTLRLNGLLNYVWLSGTFDGSMYHNSGFTGNAFGNMRYKFNKGFAISFNAGYYSGNVNLQGKSSDYIFNQYLFSKDFFNRKMTIVLVANNPYSKYYTNRTIINSAEFYQNTYNQTNYRSLAVRLNFKFGKLKGDIKRNEHGIENDDTKSDGKKSPTANQ